MAEKKLKINLGCGFHCPEGWLNIDGSIGVYLGNYSFLRRLLSIIPNGALNEFAKRPWPKGIKKMNLTEGIKLGTGTVDYAYTSHFIEHLSYLESKEFLNEVFRVMKSGGILRIVTPDFSRLVDDYLLNQLSTPEAASAIFHRNSYYFDLPYTGTFLKWIFLFFQRKNNHHFLFDEGSLRYLLKSAGFSSVTRQQFESSQAPIIFNPIESKDRAVNSLILEAIK